MIEWFNQIDTSLLLFLNSLHSPVLDSIMYFLSYNKIFMQLILLVLIALGFKQYKLKFFGIFFFCLIAFGLSDSISSRVFKPTFKRLRPCHQPAISEQVHIAKDDRCWGGKYGFISSHAANSFAIATFFWLILKAHFGFSWILFIHSSLVAYSRVHLGKHYPLDIIFGAMLGIFSAYLCFRLVKKLILDRH